MRKSVLIDGREFVTGRRTGIGRFLEGLLLAAVELHPEWDMKVLMTSGCALPVALGDRVGVLLIEASSDVTFGSQCSKLSRNVDLFLSPYPKLPLTPLHCPAIHTVHDILYLTHEAYRGSKFQYWLDRIRLKLALHRADLTWFDSSETRSECQQMFGVNSEARVRYPAIESSFTFSRQREQSQSRYFLYVGNGLPHKNIDILLQALGGMDGRLKCVGVKEVFAEKLIATYPDITEKVEFLQHVDDAALHELYQSATALLLPSTAEGYGYPPLEAMGCGTPAIVADIPVLRETTGGFALYCPPFDAKSWRDSMLQVQKMGFDDGFREPLQAWIADRQGVKGWQHHIRDMERVMEKS